MPILNFTRSTAIRMAVVAVLAKAVLLFGVFPFVIAIFGDTYQGQLFPDNYDLIALNVADGHGYKVYPETSSTMLRTPGFVLMLAGIFFFAGKSIFAVQLVNFVLSIVSAAIVYVLANRISRLQVTAATAAIIALFHPGVILSETRGGLETTLTLTITALVFLCVIALETMRRRDYVALGLVFGFAMLVKSSVALVLPMAFAYVLVCKPLPLAPVVLIQRIAISLMVSLVVLLPWIARNYNISGRFVPTMTVSGLAQFQGAYVAKNLDSGKNLSELLHEASNEQIEIARSMGLRVKEAFFPQFYSVADEVAYYDELGKLGRSTYLRSPSLLARTIVHNSWAFWFQGRNDRATAMNVVLMLPFLVFFAVGAYQSRKDWRAILILVSIIAFVAPHLVILATTRYSVPLIPIMSILVAVPIGNWLSTSSRSASRKPVCDSR